MSRLSPTLAVRDRMYPWSAICTRELHRSNVTQTELATGVLGLPNESSFRNYLASDHRAAPTSPRFNELCRISRRLPAPMLLDVLQTLAGERALVCLVDNQGVPAGARPADIVRKLIQTLAGFDALLQDAYERCGDGEVSPDDAASIAKGWAEVRGLGEQMVRLSQHCAAQAGRNR